MLLRAVNNLVEGKEPPHIIRDSMQNDFSKLRSIKGVLPVGTTGGKLWKGWKQMTDENSSAFRSFQPLEQ